MKPLSTVRIIAVGILLAYGLPALATGPISSEQAATVGANVAIGAKVTLWPTPNYRLCTDPDDAVQLTDGKSTTDYFWTQKGTVGWSAAAYAVITVDLGKVQPISGVSFTTAAGAAQVTWPAAVQILTSDDDKTYHNAGDLIAMDRKAYGPLPESYAIRRLTTDELRTRGRYVRFVAIPPAGGSYLFVDEVEVYRGPEELLTQTPASEPVEDVANLFIQWRSRSALTLRFQADASALETQLRETPLPDEAVRARLLDRLVQASKNLDPEAIQVDRSFRAILPLSEAHGRLFQIQAALWQAKGCAPLVAEAAGPWDPLDPFSPPTDSDSKIVVHTMRGEHRAAALNLYNASEEPLQVTLRFEGLPGQPSPGYVTVYEVDWTDTGRGVPVAAALREIAPKDSEWTIQAPPGLVRQVWLNFHVPRGEKTVAVGTHEGRIVLSSPDASGPVAVPIQLHVYPVDFPEKTTLRLGGWSYTNGGGACGITPENRAAFVRHLQDRHVNAPWATASVLMKYTFPKNAPDRIELDTEQLDAWLAEWPNASAYMVFLAVGDYSGALTAGFAGAAVDTPEFQRRVGMWISAWVRHLRDKGIEPGRLGLLIHDEPHEGSDVTALVAWSRAIRAAEPGVRIWLDPTYHDPAKAPGEVFEATDVLCPNRPMWLGGGKPFADFFMRQQRLGKELQLYSCSGPARLLDPYAYYRLQAWQCWRDGATGTFFWAFGDNSGASSWNEYLAKSGPYTPLFLDETHVAPAKQMEAIRESVEDYETLLLLKRTIESAEQSGRDGPEIQAARKILDSAAAEVLDADGASELRWHDAKDRSIADAVRTRVLQALSSL